MGAAAQQLRPCIGLSRGSDDKKGTEAVFGPNLSRLRELFRVQEQAHSSLQLVNMCLDGDRQIPVAFNLMVCTDVGALRHCERMLNSGWCCCERDFALRRIPTKPKDISEMHTLLKQCHSPTFVERCVWGHVCVPGEDLPRPCTAPGCTFAHDTSTAATELKSLLQTEKDFEVDQSKTGKARFSKWRSDHARKHFNVQPGAYGYSLLQHNMDDQLLDRLHLAELGAPKIAWKHGVLNNCSDDARDAISEYFKSIDHPLDTRRKEDNRSRHQKWFTGEAWASFLHGH